MDIPLVDDQMILSGDWSTLVRVINRSQSSHNGVARGSIDYPISGWWCRIDGFDY